ncbi:carbohydrate binding domain-containing protein [Microbacterium sp. SLBN-146]|uniref:carbohydrate binding domain-containing protein n=1 Tax=Microbacterium sp. SLBN-146 TaxID=2768457 RepID=UPI0011523AC5|nr:carbohydrate binding domain-containing protein [Microbacterium sp. SLBN-146]TQJ31108.1 carbohydrate binding protein with CBM11 domain [Microbacterium sp. SLBN-146]
MTGTHLARRGIAAATLSALVATALVPAVAASAADETITTLYDFEDGTSSHIQWGAAGAGVQAVADSGVGSWSDSVPNTNVLSYGFDLAAEPFYGGMGFEFSGAQPAQDWSAYDGLQFWMHSDGSASSIQVELLDAVSADSTVHDRWDVVVPLGAAGWNLVKLPFSSFGYATDFQDGGAPHDGSLDLDVVRGLLFPANAGTAVVKLDEIALYAGAVVAPSVGVTATALDVVEGSDATIPVRLSTAPTSDVTVDYATVDGTAAAGTDYPATSGTLTFAAGSRDAQIVVPTTANDTAEGNRTFTVSLANPSGATLGAATTTVTIRDDDSAPAGALSLLTDPVEDFESELVLGDPAAVPPLGWFAAQGAGNVPSFERVADASRPGAADGNDALSLGFDTSSWAVVIDTFTTGGSTWDPQDWSAYRGVGFWMRGSNSGAPMFVDVLDNRNPGSTVDDAERMSVRFVDDWTGWRFVELPFADFTRKNIGNGAPDDGFTLTEVHGIGIGVEQTPAPVTPDILIDDITLVGQADANRPLTINVARAIFTVDEGDDAEVLVRLTRASDEDVTVSYRTDEAVDRTSTEDLPATPDVDYVTTSGTVTIPAGSRDAIITVPTIADGKAEVDETFLVRLSDPVGAELNPLAVARVSILDSDEPVAGLLDDFENGTAGLGQIGDATLSTRLIAASDADAYEGQDVFDNVLDIDGNGGYARSFAQPQDWSAQEGIGFWYEGEGDGRDVTLRVQDATPVEAAPEDWTLAWSDEFDAPAGTAADSRYWTYETGGWGWGNDELQYYSDSTDNAAHDGEGNMVITTRAVEDPAAAGLECWYGPCEYTSARLITENKVEVLHGRMEARAQMPAGEAGIWPAIWTLGNDFRDVGWPRTGEIDIMEFVGKLPDEIFGTIHGPGYSGGQAYGDTYDFGENLGGQWLTFAVEWEEGEIRWYVQRDGGEEILYHTATPADVAPSDWVYEHPFTLLMNMAVGGNFGGPLADTLAFPQELKVDYVRVYQAPDAVESFETTFVDDEPGWRFVQLPFADFERSAEQPDGAADDGFGRTSVTGYEVEVSGAPATVESFARSIGIFAVADGAVSLDKVQVLADVTDPGAGGGGTGGDGTGGDGSGSGSAPGSGAASGSGQGGLAATGGVDLTPFALLALLLMGVGVTFLRRKRLGVRTER